MMPLETYPDDLMTAAPGGTAGRLVSLTRAAPGLTLPGFLRAAHGRERFYWENLHDPVAFAGMGIAVELTAWGVDRFRHIESQARMLFAGAHVDDGGQPAAHPRLFGGFAFSPGFAPDNTWAVFAPAQFVLPHFQLTLAGGTPWLTMNVHIAPDESLEALLPELRAALDERYARLRDAHAAPPQAEPETPGDLQLQYPMSFSAWDSAITRATARMAAGEMQKVVLARIAEVRQPHSVNIEAALETLAARYADCYRFLFEPQPGHAFFGATPELLVRVQGHQMATMGLAGSIRRGASPEEDAALGTRLLEDPKERYEHALVVDEIERRLSPLTDTLHVPAVPTLIKLGNIQHLHTPINGWMRAPSGVLPLVALLHPTPALGGQPSAAALAFIQEAEPAPRGWYAAPVGFIDHTLDGVFVVAIRSAVVQDRRAWLYAGAGIVADSQPQKEWDETALKFRPMLGALGIEAG